MLHPPQEGSDRILTYGTLLDVFWEMYHTWITYGTVRRIALTLDRLDASMKKHQEKLLFWKGDTKESDRIPAKKTLV